ncbi:hypothetical protein M23134_03696 [Microscilla marina ATCC 23134]|uniref:Uncharacterized protein n=1 Tax=Microscilla marina ATCC 23134 TaxID=313606 RepID=A1ZXA7_MICM2|nr:hypothetical protein M23134_03696 [Microscilla marina ATCC 23134]
MCFVELLYFCGVLLYAKICWYIKKIPPGFDLDSQIRGKLINTGMKLGEKPEKTKVWSNK